MSKSKARPADLDLSCCPCFPDGPTTSTTVFDICSPGVVTSGYRIDRPCTVAQHNSEPHKEDDKFGGRAVSPVGSSGNEANDNVKAIMTEDYYNQPALAHDTIVTGRDGDALSDDDGFFHDDACCGDALKAPNINYQNVARSDVADDTGRINQLDEEDGDTEAELLNCHQCTYAFDGEAVKLTSPWAPAVWPTTDDTAFNQGLNICIATDKDGHAYANFSPSFITYFNLEYSPKYPEIFRVVKWQIMLGVLEITHTKHRDIILYLKEHLISFYSLNECQMNPTPVQCQLRGEAFHTLPVYCLYYNAKLHFEEGCLAFSEFQDGAFDLHLFVDDITRRIKGGHVVCFHLKSEDEEPEYQELRKLPKSLSVTVI